ncbi:MAG: DUF6174 domain-containing protein [Gemmatimonadaceae bacterium]|jgi:hypothetical protein|uniref:DUF6174 domain-containing protein n=1 Tax=Gemmatimonas sp. TaxID=1962908 RepID=UPI00391FB5F1
MSTVPSPRRIAVALLAALLLTACADADGSLSTTVERDAMAAQALWTRQRPAHYRYESTVICFCPAEYTQPIVAEVRNGAVVDARYPDGRVYPFSTPPRLPIDSLFVQILQPGGWVARVEATFDARYGYPKQFSVTSRPNLADGGYSVTITRFEPLP